jgi:hypothetical protein
VFPTPLSVPLNPSSAVSPFFVRACAPQSNSVRFWRMSGDKGDPEDEYPFVCYHQLPTGHWDNVFSAKMLPFSTRLYVRATFLFSPWSRELTKGTASQRYSGQRRPRQGIRHRRRSSHVRLHLVILEGVSHLETKDDPVSWEFREKDHDRTKPGCISHRFGGWCRSSDIRGYQG